MSRSSQAAQALTSGQTNRPGPTLSPATFAHKIGDLILEKKGVDLVVMDVEKVTSLTDHIVIATASNPRQVKSMALDVLEYAKSVGKATLSREGLEQAWWVLLDFGDIVVHIMQEEARGYYDLEVLWADGEVVRRSPVDEEDEVDLFQSVRDLPEDD